MKLVFIHGWGFDASFWDALSALLPQYPQQRIDLGFFGQPSGGIESSEPSILVGHSLGFVHGIQQRPDWSGWVAINSFVSFAACVPSFILHQMRKRFEADPENTLRDFYRLIGAMQSADNPNAERLLEGLDELRDGDVGDTLAALNIPNLILAARHDPLVPVGASEDLAQYGKILWHDNDGHILPQSDPVWCANAIRNFLKQHESSTA